MDIAFKLGLLIARQGPVIASRKLVDPFDIGLRKARPQQIPCLVRRNAPRVRNKHALPDREFRIGNRFCRAHAFILSRGGFLSTLLAKCAFMDNVAAKIQCNRSAVKTRSQLRKNAPSPPGPKDMEVRGGVCVKLTGAKQTISWAAPPAPPHFFRRYCAFMNGIHLPSAPRTCDESVRWSSLMNSMMS